MTKIRLDSVLLFALVIPFVMAVRIGPGETPFWLFSIIFTLLFSYFVLDVVVITEKLRFLLKQIILWITVFIVIGSAFGAAIIVRHQTSPVYMIHDIIVQQEAAIRYLVHGVNPYQTTYFGTPLEQWNYSPKEINPALYHFVNGPFYLLFALPFYYISNHTIGYFDGRIPLLFLFFSILISGYIFIKNRENKLLFLLLMAFNPAILGYTLEGRSDLFMYAFLFGGFILLFKKRYSTAGALVALAFATKQSAWPLFPLYLAFLFFNTKSVSKSIKSLLLFIITFVVVAGPFFAWNSKAFLDSTVFYLSGNTPNSYPISGYGLGSLLLSLGFIKNSHVSYPFLIWQLILGLPVLAGSIFFLKQSPTVKRLIFTYGLFLFVFWYSSRYFNNSHLGFLSVVFLTAYFFPEDKE